MAGARRTSTGVLDIAYDEHGDPAGTPVVLAHGFPYDARAYDDVAALLPGFRVVVPDLRGFGATRFRDPRTPRSGQQAAVGQDLLDLLDALGIERAVLGGYDWGGRAACIVAARWPERVLGLVTAGGYLIQHLPSATEPLAPEQEQSIWYQYYLRSARGEEALRRHREDLCALLWRTWSPAWAGAMAAFPASAPSLHNPDFVAVVVHSYRHRFGLVPGDPAHDELEAALAARPPIPVPAVVLEPLADGILGPPASAGRDCFTGPYRHVALPGIGHDVPQEAPTAFAAAIRSLGA